MSEQGIIKQLKQLAVENRPYACIGCGYEHNCSIHGCAVIKLAIIKLEEKEESGE